jgi:uncharacterized membrane protein
LTERHLRAGIGALAAVGLGLTAYLLYVRQTGTTLTCTTGGCETVQSSRYSEVFGVPVAALGLVAYVVLLATACLRSDLARLAQAVVALSAFAFSAYLVYVQLHVIGAVCDWCVVSDVVTTGATALVLLRLRAATMSPA